MSDCATHTHNCVTPSSRTTRVSLYEKKHSPTQTHPDHQTSFIKCCDPGRPPCLIYVLGSFFPNLSWPSLVFLLVWNSISYSIHFFTQLLSSFCNTCTIATCFAEVPKLCHLFLSSLSTISWKSVFYLIANIHLTIFILAF